MLGQLGGWADDLGSGHILVWQEDELEEVASAIFDVDLLQD